MESKKEIYDMMPQTLFPKTILILAHSSSENILQAFKNSGLLFPVIGKPDIGMKGLAVKKLEALDQLLQYGMESKVDFLLQQFVPYDAEVGIFYYRYPNEKNGHISGIVGKEFLSVTGNGKDSIHELILKDPRFILQLHYLKDTFGDELNAILPHKQPFLLVPYGNHSRGAKFLDYSHLIEAELSSSIDKICKQIPGFYFGRMDIRYLNWEDLKQGKNFSIIELNGAGSEPTHMYDPKHSILFAWKEIIRHLNILLKISILNHQAHRIPYMKFSEGWKMIKENAAYVKMIQPNLTPKE